MTGDDCAIVLHVHVHVHVYIVNMHMYMYTRLSVHLVSSLFIPGFVLTCTVVHPSY